eukprot:5858118-Amphidinium_carterae.1
MGSRKIRNVWTERGKQAFVIEAWSKQSSQEEFSKHQQSRQNAAGHLGGVGVHFYVVADLTMAEHHIWDHDMGNKSGGTSCGEYRAGRNDYLLYSENIYVGN